MQRDLHVAGGQGDPAAFLPMPLGALGAELGGDGLSVDDQLEAAGGAGGVPVGDPILGAHPDAVFACGGDPDGAGGVGDRLAEAVGQEVGRADDVGESRIELPAARGGQGFGFDEDRVGGLGAAGGGGKQGQSEEGKHAGGHGSIRCRGGGRVPEEKGWKKGGGVGAGVLRVSSMEYRVSGECLSWGRGSTACCPSLPWVGSGPRHDIAC